MRPVGQFVPKPTARKLHFREPLLGHEDLDGPLDGCQPQRRHDPLAVLEDLIGREGAVDVHEHATDRPALTGVSLHRSRGAEWECSVTRRCRRQPPRSACPSSAQMAQASARQTRAPCRRAPASVRLPATDVMVSGSGSSQPARDAAQSTAPPTKVRTTGAFVRAGPMTSVAAPTRTVATHTPLSMPSESASAGAATTRSGVSAQCRPHKAAAYPASRDPEARYVVGGAVARKLLMGLLRRKEQGGEM